jgi:phage/plasmid-like protein (TIGR03299 family)
VDDVGEEFEQITDFTARVRSDDGFTLGVVPTTLALIKNEEMYDIAEALQGKDSEVRFETGGSVSGGRKVWLLIRFNDPLLVGGRSGTEVIPYYALQNDHSGGGAFRGQATMVAIVCDNTSRMADIDAQARGTEFVFRHTSKVQERIDEAKAALEGWRTSVVEWQRFSDFMIDQRVSREQIAEFIRTFIPMPPPHMASERVENNVRVARQTLLDILKGPTCAETLGTGYGLIQAALEYNQHYRAARSAETRFKRAYLDKSTVTTDAVNIVKELVGA